MNDIITLIDKGLPVITLIIGLLFGILRDRFNNKDKLSETIRKEKIDVYILISELKRETIIYNSYKLTSYNKKHETIYDFRNKAMKLVDNYSIYYDEEDLYSELYEIKDNLNKIGDIYYKEYKKNKTGESYESIFNNYRGDILIYDLDKDLFMTQKSITNILNKMISIIKNDLK